MKISQTFSSGYFKAADVPTPRTLVIESVTSVTFNEGTKPLIRFKEEKQQLVVNKTNAFVLAHAYGDDTDLWPGHQIQLFSATTTYKGRPTEGICVRPLSGPSDVNARTLPAATGESPLPAVSVPTPPQPAPQQLPPNQIPAAQQPTPPAHRPLQAPRINYES